MQGKILIVILFALIVAIFSIQNANPVFIKIFTWEFEVSLVYIILGAVALGAIIMGIFSSIRQIRLGKKLREARGENKKLEEINRVMEERLRGLQNKKNIDDESVDKLSDNKPDSDKTEENKINKKS